MSEYTPITGELRAAMHQLGWVESDGSITFTSSSMPPSIDAEQSLAISGSDFDRYCDAIDAVHAQLERENESLKAELDRVLGEDERNGWMELPRDTDGEYIHIGDVMEGVDKYDSLKKVMGKVITVSFESDGAIDVAIQAWSSDGRSWHRAYLDQYASVYRHHHAPDTWERIIEDALDGYHDTDFEKLVARCKALCERTKEVGE